MDTLFTEWNYTGWLALALLLGILEMLSATTYLLWIALGAVVTAIFSFITPLNVLWQCALFAISSVIWIVVGSRYIQPFQHAKKKSQQLNKRGSQHINQVYVLEEPIENGRGRIKVGDSFWKVKGPDLPAGASIKVIDIEDMHLIVEAKD